MPLKESSPVDVAPDDTLKIVEDGRGGTRYAGKVTTGTINWGSDRGRARLGEEQASAGERFGFEIGRDGESVFVHNPGGSTATFEIRKQGFFFDFILPDFTVNRPMDVAAQTGPDLTQEQVRDSSQSVAEVNGDQTKNVGADGSQDTTITADAGEIWEILQVGLRAEAISGATGNHQWTVQTESQGVNYGLGESSGTDVILFRNGAWKTATVTAESDMEGAIIDDTNGMNFSYINNTDTTQTKDRLVRVHFRVIEG